MCLALIVENKSMRHSLGKRVGGVGRFSRTPMIHLTLYVSALLQSLRPFSLFPTPFSCYLFSLCNFLHRLSFLAAMVPQTLEKTLLQMRITGLDWKPLCLHWHCSCEISPPCVWEYACVCGRERKWKKERVWETDRARQRVKEWVCAILCACPWFSSCGRQEWEWVGCRFLLKRIPAMLGIIAWGVLMGCSKIVLLFTHPAKLSTAPS